MVPLIVLLFTVFVLAIMYSRLGVKRYDRRLSKANCLNCDQPLGKEVFQSALADWKKHTYEIRKKDKKVKLLRRNLVLECSDCGYENTEKELLKIKV